MKRFIDNIQRIDNELAQFRKKCKCGHTQVVAPGLVKNEYILCTHCGGRLYKDDDKQAAHNEKVNRENFRMFFRNYCKKN